MYNLLQILYSVLCKLTDKLKLEISCLRRKWVIDCENVTGLKLNCAYFYYVYKIVKFVSNLISEQLSKSITSRIWNYKCQLNNSFHMSLF